MKEFFKRALDGLRRESDTSKDRAVGLVVFGTVDILFGIFCFSLAMLLLVTVSSMGMGALKPVQFRMAEGFLFFQTGWFIVMGLGSIKARRWARALFLVGAWMAIFFGTLALALILYVLPEVYGIMAVPDALSPAATLGMLYFAVFVLVLLQVVFPVIGIFFYGSPSVRATCERINPKPSWTDRHPLPLLAMAFVSATGTLSIAVAGSVNYTVFFFGRIIDGLPGFAVVALISVACGYVGWGAFTRRMHVWWGAYGLVFLVSSSLMLTFSEMDMPTIYAHMGYSAAQIENLQRFYPFNSAMLTYMACVWGIMACIYLLWVRDCFRPDKDRLVVKSYQQRKAEEEAAKPVPAKPRPRMRLDD